MSNLGDIIKVIGTTKDVKWYSMLECEAQIEDSKRVVHLPACFLKQIGVKFAGDDSINDDDFMLTFKKYNKPKFSQCLPQKPQYISAGKNRVKKYFEPLLPTKYKISASAKRDKFYRQLYYIIRIASCSCVLSCSANKSIEGIEDICDNSPPDWQDYGMKFSAIEDAVFYKGKLIGPLQGTYYFTGWKIISMIYSMLWCNSEIHNNRNELFSIIEILSSVDKYVQQLIPQYLEFTAIIDLLKTKIHTPELSKEAWVIVFLYIRNYYWSAEYVSQTAVLFDISQYPSGTFGKLQAITEKWELKNDDDFMKKIKKLSPEDFAWIYELLLGGSDRVNASKDRYANIRNLKKIIEPLMVPLRFTAFRTILLQVSQYDDDCSRNNNLQGKLNLGLMICVEMMLYNSITKIEIPTCNNLNFVRNAGKFDSVDRGKKYHSILKLAKGMKMSAQKNKILFKLSKYRKMTAQKSDENYWDEFSQYEKMYCMLTGPIKAAITTGNDLNGTYSFCCTYWFKLQNQLKILLQYMSVNNIEYMKAWGKIPEYIQMDKRE